MLLIILFLPEEHLWIQQFEIYASTCQMILMRLIPLEEHTTEKPKQKQMESLAM